MLKKRGALIKGEKEQEEIEEIEKEIEKIRQTIIEEEGIEPKTAIITFSHPSALNVIKSITEDDEPSFLLRFVNFICCRCCKRWMKDRILV